ncbi:hypothetical protein BDQ17DRAFT_1355532 [Cyathus striatus]|nr:hypothetical protein BDQ17DRAFT_1355532 [Cyathus striatus]
MEEASASPLFLAKLLYAGNAIVMLMYGIYFTLVVICLHYLYNRRSRNRLLLGYLIVSLLVTTVFLAASGKYTELILIESATNPLGIAKLSARLDLAQRVAYSVKIWLADALLIYRLWVVWVGSFMIIVFPCILFVATIATGIAGVALYYEPTEVQPIVHLGVSFHACSVALNVLVTVLIAGKLLYQRRLTKDLGEDHERQYLSLLAVFAESGALYGIVGIIYIPLYATGNNMDLIFAALLEAASGIAPALILLRMALGVAVSMKTQALLSTLKFGNAADREKGFTHSTTTIGQVSTVPSSHITRVDDNKHRRNLSSG